MNDIGVITNSRKVGDFGKRDNLFTPSWATEAMLDCLEKESLRAFQGRTFLEPACGDGAISKILHGRYGDRNKILSNDFFDDGYEQIDSVQDFVKSHNPEWDKAHIVITNPPYNQAEEFIEKTLSLPNLEMGVFLLRLAFLEGVKRKNKFYSQGLLDKVMIHSRRVNFILSTGNPSRNAMAMAWFVFSNKKSNRSENNKMISQPKIDWI